MAIKIQKKTERKITGNSLFLNTWSNIHYGILGAGILLLVIGYLLMTTGPWDNPISLTLSPIILVIAYLVVIPSAIMLWHKTKSADETTDSSAKDVK